MERGKTKLNTILFLFFLCRVTFEIFSSILERKEKGNGKKNTNMSGLNITLFFFTLKFTRINSLFFFLTEEQTVWFIQKKTYVSFSLVTTIKKKWFFTWKKKLLSLLKAKSHSLLLFFRLQSVFFFKWVVAFTLFKLHLHPPSHFLQFLLQRVSQKTHVLQNKSSLWSHMVVVKEVLTEMGGLESG